MGHTSKEVFDPMHHACFRAIDISSVFDRRPPLTILHSVNDFNVRHQPFLSLLCMYVCMYVCMYENIYNAPLLQPKQSRVRVLMEGSPLWVKWTSLVLTSTPHASFDFELEFPKCTRRGPAPNLTGRPYV